MAQQTKRALALMLDTSAHEDPIFVADLYSGLTVEDSVYLCREAMIEWVCALDPSMGFLAARAMDRLAVASAHTIIEIPLGAGMSRGALLRLPHPEAHPS